MSVMVDEMGVTELREKLADVVNGAVLGQITYVTSRGRRVAAVVPVPVAADEEAVRAGDLDHLIARLQSAGYIVRLRDEQT